MNLKELSQYGFCCIILALFAACDPFSFTSFNFENSLDEEVTMHMVFSDQSFIQGDTTFTLQPNSALFFQQFEERSTRPSLDFNIFGELFDSIIAINANGDSSIMLNDESRWDLKMEGSDATYCLVIDETDF